MKNKKTLIIVGVIGLLLIVTGLVTSYADSARVRNGIKPQHVIKIASEDGNKVTYWGLGYKVILYPSVSPNEPYKNNHGVKYGSWFMKYELEEEKESKYTPTEVENVSARISDISLTSATLTIKDTSITKYTYGEWYKLEKEIDGKWYELNTKIENYGFNSIGYNVDENHEVKFIMDWDWLYGELPLGSYRIIKEAHNKYIAIPFSIAKTSSSQTETIKMNLFDRSEIIKVAIDNYSQYKNNFEYTDKDTIDKIYNVFKDLETKVAGKNNEPENPEELYKVTFYNDENMLLESDNDIFKAIVYVYKRNNKYYVEEPKNGIYEVTEEDFNLIKSYIN